jgi:hypothetical protein
MIRPHFDSAENEREFDRTELAWLRYKAGRPTDEDWQYLAYSRYSPLMPACHTAPSVLTVPRPGSEAAERVTIKG